MMAVGTNNLNPEITGEIIIGGGLGKAASKGFQSAGSTKKTFGLDSNNPNSLKKISKAEQATKIAQPDRANYKGPRGVPQNYTNSNGRDGHKLGQLPPDTSRKRRAAQNALNEGRTGEAQGHLANLAFLQKPPRVSSETIIPSEYMPPAGSEVIDAATGHRMKNIDEQQTSVAASTVAKDRAEQEEKKASKKEDFERTKERLDFQYAQYKEKKAEHDAYKEEYNEYITRTHECGQSFGGQYAHSDACRVELPKMRNAVSRNKGKLRKAMNEKYNAITGVNKEIGRLGQPDMADFGGKSHWQTLYPTT